MISSLAGTHPGLTGLWQVGLFIFGIAVAGVVGRAAIAKMVSRQKLDVPAGRCLEA
jgi:hypothetical protein